MCGRFYIAEEDKAEELQRIIDLMNRKYNGDPGIKTHGEICPTDTIMTIANSPSLEQRVFAMKWGYTMPDGQPMFNARSETAAVKPLFADGTRRRAKCASVSNRTSTSKKPSHRAASGQPC